MNKSELQEAVSLLQQVLVALLATAPTKAGASAASLRLACGALSANAATEIAANTPWPDLANCFEQARLANASYIGIDAVRTLVEGFAPRAAAGIAVANFSVRMALAEQAQILAATTFTSRAQIDRYLDQVNDNFDTAVEVAADRHDNVAYRALIGLRAAVVNDLATRARPLPQIVALEFPTRLPAFTLAQRIYQDGSRGEELVAENSVVHPLFMPRFLRALSA